MKPLRTTSLALAVSMAAIGCGTEVDQRSGCELNTSRSFPCGFQGKGTLEQLCVPGEAGKNEWTPVSACPIPEYIVLAEGTCPAISGDKIAFVSPTGNQVLLHDLVRGTQEPIITASADTSYKSFGNVRMHGNEVAFTSYKISLDEFNTLQEPFPFRGIVDGVHMYNSDDGSITRLSNPSDGTLYQRGLLGFNENYALMQVFQESDQKSSMRVYHYSRAGKEYNDLTANQHSQLSTGAMSDNHIVYFTGEGQTTRITILEGINGSMGGRRTRELPVPMPDTVSLAHDHVLFDSGDFGKIFRYELERVELRQLSPVSSFAFHPALSPTGEIVFKVRTGNDEARVGTDIYGRDLSGYEEVLYSGRPYRTTPEREAQRKITDRILACPPSIDGHRMAVSVDEGIYDNSIIVYQLASQQ